ncbi:restriction endonuclease subunit S [Streptococcus parasuis]|nr:restriction endonuclease subunit S [Streptococcus parasuis]QXF05227.1 restriction endonuclease subunit S [Streptococcus parasuis]
MADGTVQKVEVPYDIPDSWEWVRLGTIISAKGGKRIPKGYNLQEEDNGHPYLRVTDMKNGTIVPNSIKYAPDTVYEKIKNYTISSNDIYITIAGTIGDIGVVPKKFNNALLTENALKLMLTSSVNKMFLVYLLNSQLVQQQFKEVYNQVAQPKLSIRSTNSTLIPLPPLSEQKRIVEQIERALEKVDAYSESYNKLQELDKNFPDKLKKSILQYAMQGKLVPQAPDDEPVEVLLEKIKAEKQKLYEEGKLKKKDLEEFVVTKGDDNSPYGKIPQNWFFLTIKDIFSITTGLSYKKTDLAITKNGVRIIRGGNISPFSFKILDNDYYIDSKFITSETVYLKRNQLVTPVSTSLEHIGKFARIDKDYPNTVAGGFVFQLTPFVSSDVLSKYLLFNLSSPIFYKQLKSITKLSGQALYNIPKTKLNELLVPLAPSTEQERISQRVEQLFEKVNQL